MPSWPLETVTAPLGGFIHPGSPQASTCNAAEFAVVNYTAAAAPAANRAIFVPFILDNYVTARQMFWENTGVAGTTDVGIYDYNYTRLVSSGPTTNVGTIQIVNIADTLLGPGLYRLAFLPSTVTTQTYWQAFINVSHLRLCGVTQQAVGAATLPTPSATPAALVSAFLPFVGVSFQAVM